MHVTGASMSAIQLRLEGKGADKLTESLEQFLAAEWDVQASAKQASATNAEGTKDLATAAAVAGGIYAFMKFVIDLPKFLDANADLAKRAKAKQRLEQLIAWTEANFTDPSQVLWLEVNGIPHRVKTAQLVEMLNAMQE